MAHNHRPPATRTTSYTGLALMLWPASVSWCGRRPGNGSPGQPLRCPRGHDAIREFYAAFQDAEKQTELVELRVSGSDAVFLWQLMLDVGDSRTKISPISQMTFDDDAKITSMRAFWSPEDAHVV